MTPLNFILVYFLVKQISAQLKIYQSFLFLEKLIDCKCILKTVPYVRHTQKFMKSPV